NDDPQIIQQPFGITEIDGRPPRYGLPARDVDHSNRVHGSAAVAFRGNQDPTGPLIGVDESAGLVQPLGFVNDLVGLCAGEIASGRNRHDVALSKPRSGEGMETMRGKALLGVVSPPAAVTGTRTPRRAWTLFLLPKLGCLPHKKRL